MWTLCEREMPRQDHLVLFKWSTFESIQAGTWFEGCSVRGTKYKIFVVNGSSLDGDDPTSWCEIPE